MKTRKYLYLASVVLLIAVLVSLLLPVQAFAVSVVPVYSVNGPFAEIRGLDYTSADILLLTSKSVVPMYSISRLFETMAFAYTSADILLLTSRSIMQTYSFSRLFEIMALTYTSIDIPLQMNNGIAAGIVASMIIIAFARKNDIEKVINAVRYRLIGHYKGPPLFAVWFLSLARALEGVIVYFTDIVARYNVIKAGNATAVTTPANGDFMDDIPFSLGVATGAYVYI